MKILVIIPAFNEEDNIRSLIVKLRKIPKIKLDLLVINDYSSDDTASICHQLKVNVLDLPCNLGIGGAVQAGYKYAKKYEYDIAIQVDGDGQHNPEYIEHLIFPIVKRESDFVIGSRYINKEGFQSTRLRRIGISYFSKLIKFLSKEHITDPTSGFRACNSNVINLFAEYYPTDYPEPESIVSLVRNGYKIVEVPVIMNERAGGISSIRSFKTLYYMIKVSSAIIIDIMRKPMLIK